MTASLPAYAVPGIKPVGGTVDLRSAEYSIEQLVSCPPVAAAISRTPAVLLAICFDGDERDDWSVNTADLCGELWIGTGDGLSWEFSFGDCVNHLIDIASKFFPEDLLADALAAQPDVDSVYHYDREVYHLRLSQVHRADEIAARWLDAIVTAHREFARGGGIALPY